MNTESTQGMPDKRERDKRLAQLAGFLAACVALNFIGSFLAYSLALPMYLDTIGTVVAAAVGGPLPGMLAGYLTNFLAGLFDPSSTYYGTVNVLIGLAAAMLARRGWLQRLERLPVAVCVFSLIGGGLGSALSWCLSGFALGERATAPLAWFFVDSGWMSPFAAQMVSGIVVDVEDKLLSVLVAFVILLLLRRRFPRLYAVAEVFRSKTPEELMTGVQRSGYRIVSLRSKILRVITLAGLFTVIMSAFVSAMLYRQSTIEEHTKLGRGVASLAASVIDADRVEDFLALGDEADGYKETELRLYAIRNSTPDIEYVYIYQIQPDGCHVVFDLDTEDVPGEDPGTVVPFDESFADYLPDLLAGEEIEPLITNDTYGWLMTAYYPVRDSGGVCRCYAAADISMGQITAQEVAFLSRQTSLFLGFLLLLLCVGVLSAEYSLIIPINSIAAAAGAFAYNSSDERARSVDGIRALKISTGDEIENLYHAFSKTTEDTMAYIADAQKKADTITRMQNGLILVLAEIVESRDRNTGDHVRKTAMYVRIIAGQMRREGMHPEILTEEYIDLIANAAPLHDIGKIHVPDAVLNKPGRLTDEEFREMKDHTTEGREIITRAIRLVPDSGYLSEARDMASYHHERWDGKGYPNGLAGEAIPLSARIMAVADVFDALISHRSYKEGFPFDTSVNIIREGAGTHFDPQVVDAFLHAEEEIKKAADAFHRQYETRERTEAQ